MARAEVGDDVWEEDPTVKRLEALAAERLGKEAALRRLGHDGQSHLRAEPHAAGQEVVLDLDSRIFNYDARCGDRQRPDAAGEDARFLTPDQVSEALRVPRTSIFRRPASSPRTRTTATAAPAARRKRSAPSRPSPTARRSRSTSTARGSSTRRSPSSAPRASSPVTSTPSRSASRRARRARRLGHLRRGRVHRPAGCARCSAAACARRRHRGRRDRRARADGGPARGGSRERRAPSPRPGPASGLRVDLASVQTNIVILNVERGAAARGGHGRAGRGRRAQGEDPCDRSRLDPVRNP